MKIEKRDSLAGNLVAAAALAAVCAIACSKTSGAGDRTGGDTFGGCTLYVNNCNAPSPVMTWQSVPTPAELKPILQLLSAGGCSDPMSYTPCKDGKCRTPGGEATMEQNISVCPRNVAEATAKSSGSPWVKILDPVTDGCDVCTGVPPNGWAIITWPPSDAQPHGCTTPHC